MMDFLKGGTFKLIAIGLLVVAIGGYIGALKIKNARLETNVAELTGDLQVARQNLAQAVEVNKQNEHEIELIRQGAAAADDAVASYVAEIENMRKQTQPIRKEIIRVIATQPATCPASASIVAALDGLRARKRAADSDQDRAGGDLPAEGAAPVR